MMLTAIAIVVILLAYLHLLEKIKEESKLRKSLEMELLRILYDENAELRSKLDYLLKK